MSEGWSAVDSWRRRVRVGHSALLGLWLVGCPAGGSLESPECYFADCTSGTGGNDGPQVPFCDPTPIFATCGGFACHGTAGSSAEPGGGVHLLTPSDPMVLGQSLLDVPAKYAVNALPTPPSPPCPTGEQVERYIDSRDPARSLILTKVKGTGHFACGAPMPGLALPAADVQCIEAWVQTVVAEGAAAPGP